MRILIIHSSGYSDLSGEKVAALSSFDILKKNGHHVSFVEYGGPNFSELVNKLILPFCLIWSIPAYFFVRKQIRTHKPDIIHFHSIFPHLSISSFVAAFRSRASVVQTLHNVRYLCLEGGFHRKGKFCNKCLTKGYFGGVIHGCYKHKFASLLMYIFGILCRSFVLKDNSQLNFIAVSDFIKRVHSDNGFEKQKVNLLYNCVSNKIDTALPFSKRKGVVFAGRLSSAKGSEIVKALIHKNNVFFHIIGKGPEQTEFIKLNRTETVNNVQLYGQIDQAKVIEVLSRAKCCIVPSQCGEAFSLVAAEAMSVGTPVICSNLGGVSEIVRTSNAGIVVEPDNIDDFDRACRVISDNPVLWQEMSHAALDYAAKNFSTKNSYTRIIKIYKDIMRKGVERENQL